MGRKEWPTAFNHSPGVGLERVYGVVEPDAEQQGMNRFAKGLMSNFNHG